MPIKPITGVSLLKHLSSQDIKLSEREKESLGKFNADPISQMLRRGLVLDLSVALGLGTSFGYLWWYGTQIRQAQQRPSLPTILLYKTLDGG